MADEGGPQQAILGVQESTYMGASHSSKHSANVPLAIQGGIGAEMPRERRYDQLQKMGVVDF